MLSIDRNRDGAAGAPVRFTPDSLPTDIQALGEDLGPIYAVVQSVAPISEADALAILVDYSLNADGLYHSYVPELQWLHHITLAKVGPWLDIGDLKQNRPLSEWRIFKRNASPPSVSPGLERGWALYLAIPGVPLWQIMYALCIRDMYTMPDNNFGDVHMAMPLRVKRTRSGTAPTDEDLASGTAAPGNGTNDYLNQLGAINSMRDCYALVPSRIPADVAPNGLQRVVAMRMINPSIWPAPHVELVVSWSSSDRVNISFPGDANQYWFSSSASGTTKDALSGDLIVTVERDNVRQTFRVRYLPMNAPSQQFEFTEVGSETDLRFDEDRDAPLIKRSAELNLEEMELRPRQLAVKITQGAVAWAGAGVDLLEMFTARNSILVFLRVRLMDSEWIPQVDQLLPGRTKFLTDRAFGDAVASSTGQFFDYRTHIKMNRRSFGPHRASMATSSTPSLASMITARLVFEFTASTGTFQLVTGDQDGNPAHITKRSYLAHKLAPVGLVTSLFFYPNAQMRAEDMPVLYSGGTNSFHPQNLPCFTTSSAENTEFSTAMLGAGATVGPPPSDDISARDFRSDNVVPASANHAAVPTSLFRGPGSANPATPIPPPAGHPRIVELITQGKRPVWFGLYLSKIHPNAKTMEAESELQLVVSDPSAILTSSGITTMRVIIHCNYRDSPSSQFTFQAPIEINLALNMAGDGRCFAIPSPEINFPLTQWQGIDE